MSEEMDEYLRSGSARMHAAAEHQKVVDKNARLALKGCEFTDSIQANGQLRTTFVKVTFKKGVLADSVMLVPAHLALYDRDETVKFVRKHLASALCGDETYALEGFDDFRKEMTGYAARAILRDLVKRYESDRESMNPVYLDDLIDTINKLTVKRITKS